MYREFAENVLAIPGYRSKSEGKFAGALKLYNGSYDGDGKALQAGTCILR